MGHMGLEPDLWFIRSEVSRRFWWSRHFQGVETRRGLWNKGHFISCVCTDALFG